MATRAVLLLALFAPAFADPPAQRKVLVELFTSQG